MGSLMISKRMALVGDALGHVALPGMGLALLLGWNVSIGAFFSLILGITLVWLFGFRTVLSMETLVGIVFVASLAIGFLIIPKFEIMEALVGDISSVSFQGGIIAVILSVGAVILVRWIYRGLTLANISEDLAETQGIRVKEINLLFLFAVAVIVALGVRVTGTLLVGALVIIPAAVSRNISKSLGRYSAGSMIIGMLSCAAGVIISRITGWAPGPLIIVVSLSLFLVSLMLKK